MTEVEGQTYVDISSAGEESGYDYFYYEKRKEGSLYNSSYEQLSIPTESQKKKKKSDGYTVVTKKGKKERNGDTKKKGSKKNKKDTESDVFYSEVDSASDNYYEKTPSGKIVPSEGQTPNKKKKKNSSGNIQKLKKKSKSLQDMPVLVRRDKITGNGVTDESGDAKKKNAKKGGSSRNKTKPANGDDEAEQLRKLIMQVDGEELKRILLNHTTDYRLQMLTHVEESLKKLPPKPAPKQKGRQWNTEFQALLDKSDQAFGIDEMKKIANLVHDFVRYTESYAKIIVDELALDDEYKTIKKASVGGVAGGEKYMVQGILFKFCLDQVIETKPNKVWMYGGSEPNDEYAMKVGGLELQGLDTWQLAIGMPALLRVPLMALIDYKGFRLVATSLLPLNKESLRYGSNDGGKTILASDPKLNGLIEKAAAVINLKPHTVGRKKINLASPGDIEGHLGTDGRYYLLDFARTMPPEAPEYDKEGRPLIPRGVFHRMLRPELVQTNPVPLSPDVFSGWGEKDANKLQSQEEVKAATKRIFDECIPALVEELRAIDIEKISGNFFKNECASAAHLRILLERVSLPWRMHRRGINLRHLGLVRQRLSDDPKWCCLLLSLAAARVFKTDFRAALRTIVRNGRVSQYQLQELVANYLNAVMSASRADSATNMQGEADKCPVPDGKMRLDVRKELERKFPGILKEEEKNLPKAEFLRNRINSKLVLFECLNLKMFVLSPHVMKKIATVNDISTVQVGIYDVVELCTNVRFSLFTWLIKVTYIQILAREKLGKKTPPLISREYSIETQKRNKEYIFQQAREECAEILEYERKMTLLATEGRVLDQGEEGSVPKKPKKPSMMEKEVVQAWVPKDDDGKPIQKERLKDGRRLLKKASGLLSVVQYNYPLSPYICLIWGDILKDLAESCTSWEKIDIHFQNACEKFEATQAMAGPFKLLWLVWADALNQYSDRAAAFGHMDMSLKLWHEADAKLAEVDKTDTARIEGGGKK